MPAKVVPMAIMLEKLMATNVLAPVSDEMARLTGKVAEGMASFVRRALA